MARKTRAAQPPATKDLKKLRSSARACTGCELYKRATQTVFGEGTRRAKLMAVGEQPGDQEDLAGRPFVGHAGHLLDQLCEELGIARELVYVTNAVKHFKWERSGKIRLHKKPNAGEIAACHPWLESEISAVRPKAILCLGATAARSVCGRSLAIGSSRGRALMDVVPGAHVFVTWHPSAILRSPDHEAREQKRSELRSDLLRAWKAASS